MHNQEDAPAKKPAGVLPAHYTRTEKEETLCRLN